MPRLREPMPYWVSRARIEKAYAELRCPFGEKIPAGRGRQRASEAVVDPPDGGGRGVAGDENMRYAGQLDPAHLDLSFPKIPSGIDSGTGEPIWRDVSQPSFASTSRYTHFRGWQPKRWFAHTLRTCSTGSQSLLDRSSNGASLAAVDLAALRISVL